MKTKGRGRASPSRQGGQPSGIRPPSEAETGGGTKGPMAPGAAAAQRQADESLDFRLGFAVAHNRYLLDTLQQLPAASVPESWLKWRKMAVRRLRHMLFVAEHGIYTATEKAREAAGKPRKPKPRKVTSKWPRMSNCFRPVQ